MAYDEDLVDRLRGVLPHGVEATERRMFGGLAFLVGGHLAVAVSGQGGLLVRCDPAETESFVGAPDVARMVMRGKELDGWLHVTADAVTGDDALRRWAAVGSAYAASLPPK